MKISDIKEGKDVMEEIKTAEEVKEVVKPEDGSTIPDAVVKEKVPEDCFITLYKDKDKDIKVLNIYTGCIVNTYFKNNVASVYVPGNHLRDGKIQSM